MHFAVDRLAERKALIRSADTRRVRETIVPKRSLGNREEAKILDKTINAWMINTEYSSIPSSHNSRTGMPADRS